MRAAVQDTSRAEVIGGIGGFAGLFDVSALTRMRRPLLATSTDGVGTKVMIARRLGVYDTIGIDLVGMVVDDLVVCGAEPLFMTDYAVFGKVTPERVAEIVGGIAAGCVQAGCALIGGETAEHPGHLGPDDFDLAGAATGVVEADRLLGEELLIPTRIYARDCLALAAGADVHAFAHVTGGGLAANLARVLPPHADAVLDRGTWRPGPVFGLLARHGQVPGADM